SPEPGIGPGLDPRLAEGTIRWRPRRRDRRRPWAILMAAAAPLAARVHEEAGGDAGRSLRGGDGDGPAAGWETPRCASAGDRHEPDPGARRRSAQALIELRALDEKHRCAGKLLLLDVG